MRFDMQLMGPVVLALLTALVVSFLMTPVVKSFAYKVGAIDVPKDARRMHHKPIPRLRVQRPDPIFRNTRYLLREPGARCR